MKEYVIFPIHMPMLMPMLMFMPVVFVFAVFVVLAIS